MNRDVGLPAWGGGVHVPAAFAGVTRLGEPKAVHAPQESGLSVFIVVGGLGLGLVILGGVVLLVTGSPGGLVPASIGALLLGLMVWNLVRLRSSVKCFVEYQHGFAVQIGSTVTEWPWQEVAAVITKDRWLSGKSRIYHETRCDIVRTSGQLVTLLGESVQHASAIAATAKEHVRANLLPQMRATYDAGQPVTCGAITVSRAGIQLEGRHVAWGEVAEVTVKTGCLTVTLRAGSPLKVSVWKIPNVELLGTLIGVQPSDMDLVTD